MVYPDYIKIDAVAIYSNIGSVEDTLAELRRKHGVEVSRRSLFGWVKDARFTAPADGVPLLFNDPDVGKRIAARQGAGLDLKGFIERNQETIIHSTEGLDRMIRTLMKELTPEKLKALKTKEQIDAFVKLETLKTKKIGFLFDLIAHAGGNDEDDIKALLSEVSRSLNGSIPETINAETVKGGADGLQ